MMKGLQHVSFALPESLGYRAHHKPYWSMPMLGPVAMQPSLRLEGLGLLQASSPGSTLAASSGSNPIVGTAAHALSLLLLGEISSGLSEISSGMSFHGALATRPKPKPTRALPPDRRT